MDKNKCEILNQALDIELDEKKLDLFSSYEEKFLTHNAYTNLISKNDEKFLFEKHIFDFFNSFQFNNHAIIN